MASSIISRNSSLQAQSLSKADVLQWFTDVLVLNVTKLEQVRKALSLRETLQARLVCASSLVTTRPT